MLPTRGYHHSRGGAEVEALQADPSKARRELGWSHKTGFEELVRLMVDAELEDIRLRKSGILKPVGMTV